MRRSSGLVAVLAMLGFLVAAGIAPSQAAEPAGPAAEPVYPPGGVSGAAPPGIELINHLVFIVQENRSFDHYFGTYESPSGESVNGIPTKPSGKFKKCIPHPVLGTCVYPYKTTFDRPYGGPHALIHSRMSVAHGKMNGFIKAALKARLSESGGCVQDPYAARCRKHVGPQKQPDLMSTVKRRVIPNYWAYADWGVLQDRMFAPTDSWSLPSHLYLFSGWAAECKSGPMTCKTALQTHSKGPYMWTDITYLLDEAGVTWTNYVGEGTGICSNWPCKPDQRRNATSWVWNPLPGFKTVQQDGQDVTHHKKVSQFFADAAAGTLPQVSWVLPGRRLSEHPKMAGTKPGHAYVTRLVNAIASGPSWADTAIFITWDDWGGFYDHVEPPRVDAGGWGIRVPGLMLSPYAKQAYVDHQMLSFDAYLKLIEDRFLGGQRLDPDTMSRPDSRPTVREDLDRLGDLADEFDFTQPPRDPAPIILDPTP